MARRKSRTKSENKKPDNLKDDRTSRSVDMFRVLMSDSAPERIGEVLKSGYIGLGPVTEEFERALCDRFGFPNFVSTNSCTSAIMLALKMSGAQGNLVISTPMTCLATNCAIREAGADIVFADVDPDTGLISVDSVNSLFARYGGKIRAVVCVDWAGQPCDLSELAYVTHRYGAFLIEDAAHSWLAEYRGHLVGTFPEVDFTCFSFQAIKFLTTGDGGGLVCRFEEHVGQARKLRWFGLDRDIESDDDRVSQIPIPGGGKYHMNDISAAIGLSNMDISVSAVYANRKNAGYYSNVLRNHPTVRPLKVMEDRNPSFWLYGLVTKERDRLIEYLNDNGIRASRVHSSNLNKIDYVNRTDGFPGVRDFDRNQVNIPVGSWMSEKDIERVADLVMAFR